MDTVIDALSNKWNNQMQRKNTSDRTLYAKPNIMLGYYNGKWYITVEDNKSIFTFLSDKKQVFMGAGFKCPISTLPSGKQVYNILPDAIQIVSCAEKTMFSPLSEFVIENMYELVYPS